MKTLKVEDEATIQEIITASELCYLGVADIDGTPYVLPMNFGYKDNVIYLHSAPDGRLIDIVQRNPKVCVTFCINNGLVFQHPQVACSYRMKSKSVVAWGEVEFEEDVKKKEIALNILMAQYSDKEFSYSDPALRNVKIWKVKVKEITCKAFAEPHERHRTQK